MSIASDPATGRGRLLADFRRVRQASLEMCRRLDPEMFRVQPMADVSPVWWNLGHTSWFFVRNVLQPFGGQSEPEDEQFDSVLNSYYASLGPRLTRARRGSITRPTTDEVFEYRRSVDRRMSELLESIDDGRWAEFEQVVTTGLNHEQQHQELFYTEIKYILWQDPAPLRRAYRADHRAGESQRATVEKPAAMRFLPFDGGLSKFGHVGAAWCWDNELPVHRQFLEPFALADRLVTNGEYSEFIADGGYRQQLLWLDNGWNAAQSEHWTGPLYWERDGEDWQEWTLDGLRPLDPNEPVTHVSFYEADAFARWRAENCREERHLRLPDERQWEFAARLHAADDEPGAFLEAGRLHPATDSAATGLRQMCGSLWQWTTSYYEPYPGYQPFAGSLSEYNSKFMDNQRVLRGGSCVTPRDHFRVSYRNFWPANTRFQFTGIRLARDLVAEPPQNLSERDGNT